jgi:tRNA(adenine34) deaminase
VVDLTAMERYNHRIDVTGGVYSDEAGALMRDFFRAVRAKRDEA